MFYLRLFLILIWLSVGCLIAMLMCLVLWKNPNLPKWIGRLLSFGVFRIMGLKIEVRGEHHLDIRPCVCVGNHQSSFDTMTYGNFVHDRTVPVGKKEIIWVPLFGLVFLGSGALMIDRQNRARAMSSLEEAMKRVVREKLAIVIFAEGTRNRTRKGMLPFKKGAFHMAILSQLPIVPIVSPPIYRWASLKDRRLRGGILPVEVLDPIPTQGLTRDDVERLAEDVRARMMAAVEKLERETAHLA